jgi:UDP-N-acetylenolpyruvoylglucosamine reductase
MESRINILISQLGELRIKKNIDIAEYTESKTSAIAKLFFLAVSNRELVRAMELCIELKIPYLVFGAGSKIRADEIEKCEGLVIKNRADQIKIAGVKGKMTSQGLGVEQAVVEAESGASLKKLSEFAQFQKLIGLEKIGELPGTIGGNLKINFPLQVLTSQVVVYDEDGDQHTKKVDELHHADVIVSAHFKLAAGF